MIVRSPKYLAGSRGAPCTFRIPGVCTGDVETVVPCHISDGHTGRGVKASDLSVADGCHACHAVFDRRANLPGGLPLLGEDWDYYGLRALQETLERRVEMGLLIVAGFDPNAKPKEREVKPRKPPAQRKPIPKSPRPIPSRPFPKRKAST